ncbi:uncharacterized protein LOC126821352, partial [Patella vulgata]|uniref:uncharacterized protein LOC126821352 n=1 Tax=Patella vulgata TaxID=6465 RepID=UPI0024A9669D
NIINVDREDVLRAGRRAFANKTFHPERGLSVRFSGGQGIDNGGPSCEFYRLAMCQIRDSPIFQGEMNEKILCPDINYKLEPDDVDALFLPVFSDEGSNDYRKELRTQTNWRDLLQDLGGEFTLQVVIVFKRPHFHPFKHPINGADTSPYANTCSHNLAIPVIEEYEDFKKVMLTALQLGLTFTNF